MTAGQRLTTLADRVFGDAPWWLRGLIIVQVVAILLAATLVSFRAALLVGPDERANVSYVQIVAEHGRLPIQDRDCVSVGLQRLQPRAPSFSCATNPGSSYEAFQPPLYYALAAPVWLAVPGLAHKVHALRLLDVLLLAVAIATLWWLCREALGRRRAYGWALGLCALCIPAVIVEQMYVGNDALEMALAPAVLAASLRAARAPYRRIDLAIASVLVGATLLTKLTSVYLVVPFGVAVLVRLWARREEPALPRIALGEVGIAALLPLIMIAPWLVDNEHRYHALTANHLAHVYQQPILNPTNERYTWHQVPALDRTIVANYLPKLCGVPPPDASGEPLRDPLSYLLLAVLLIGPIVLARRRQAMEAVCTLLPFGIAVVVFDAIHVLAQQNIDIARFLHPTVGPFGAGVALLAGPARPGVARALGIAAAALFVLAIVYWIYRAGTGPGFCLSTF